MPILCIVLVLQYLYVAINIKCKSSACTYRILTLVWKDLLFYCRCKRIRKKTVQDDDGPLYPIIIVTNNEDFV